MNDKYTPLPLVIEAVQFKGSYDSGHRIMDMFPQEEMSLSYNYGQTSFRLKILNKMDQRFYVANESDYVLRTVLGDVMIMRKELFEAMFVKREEDPEENHEEGHEEE